MAKAKISGLTVMIGADTDQFQKKINELDRVSKNVAKDLKTVSESMKLDPTAIQTYSDKFKLLQEAIDVSAQKVKAAKNAISALDTDLKNGKISPEEYAKSMEALKRQLESAEYEYERNVSALRNYEKEAKNSTTSVKDLSENVEKTNKSYDVFYEQTSKASDGQKQLSENTGKASKSYLLFYEQTSKASDEQKELTDNVDKANKSYNVFYEQTSKASDGQKQLTENTGKANKEYLLFYERTSKAADEVDELGDEQKETNAQIRDFGSISADSGKQVLSLGDLIKSNLISSAIKTGLSTIVNLAKSLARHLAEAAKKVAEFSWEAVKGAAEYEDALGYAQTVYGEMSEQSIQWAKDNSENFRISTKQLTQYMNTLGQVFHTQGLSVEESLEMTETLMEMAADLRAATGMTTDEILPVMQRGFTTSVKNFRQFGVIMTDAEVKAYALANGLAQVTVDETKLAKATADLHDKQKKAQDALTKYGEGSVELEKAEAALALAEEKYNEVLGGEADTMDAAAIIKARYLLLSERLKNIQGQNTKEAGLFNSQLALLKTKFENLRDEIGMKLLPIFTEWITKFNEFLGSERGQKILDSLVDAFARLGKKISEILESDALANLADRIVEGMPDVIDWIETTIEKIAEWTPLIGELVDKLLALFGIKTESELAKESFEKVSASVKDMADQYRLSLEDATKAVSAFAEQNGIEAKTVYDNWDEYAPQINAYLAGMYDTYSEKLTNSFDALSKFASDNGLKLSEVLTNWDTYAPDIAKYLGDLKGDYNTNTDEMIQAITDFADAHGLELQDVISHWDLYKPDIIQRYTDMKDETEGLATKVDEEFQKLPNSVQTANSKLGAADLSGLELLKSRISQIVDQISAKFDEIFGHDWEVDPSLIDQSTPDWMYGDDAYSDPFRAKGGSVKAGRMYRVNDDAGRRTEWFIPNQNGYVLNGNQVDRITNNNNSRNFSGGINIYVNSYGTNVAEVADELGAAMNRKLRMSGAII